MYILESACNDASFMMTMLFIKKLIDIIFIIAPILLILLLTIDFIKAVIEGSEDKINHIKEVAVKRVLYAVLLFFIPLIVDTAFGLLGNSSKFTSCYNNVTQNNLDKLVEKANTEKKGQEKKETKEIDARKKTQKQEAKKRTKAAEAAAKKAQGQKSNGFTSPLPVDSQYRKSNGTIAEATGIMGHKDTNRGDQSGKEVRVTKNYGGWDYIARFKDPVKASKAANCAQLAAANPNIGYSNYGNRCYTFYYELKKVNWDPSKITKKCDTVCSTFVAACINAAGVNMSHKMTGDEGGKYGNKNLLRGTGAFIIMPYNKNNLYRGDVIVNTNVHTAMAL